MMNIKTELMGAFGSISVSWGSEVRKRDYLCFGDLSCGESLEKRVFSLQRGFLLLDRLNGAG